MIRICRSVIFRFMRYMRERSHLWDEKSDSPKQVWRVQDVHRILLYHLCMLDRL